MELASQIDSHKYLYLTQINEPEDNVLRLVIEEARVDRGTDDIKIGETTITEYGPIVSDEDCFAYELIFASYIAYSVRNESYTVWDESEKWTGQVFRVYSKSYFLDYIRASTIASEDYPGPYTHYEVVCLNHIIDIASVQEPKIQILR